MLGDIESGASQWPRNARAVTAYRVALSYRGNRPSGHAFVRRISSIALRPVDATTRGPRTDCHGVKAAVAFTRDDDCFGSGLPAKASLWYSEPMIGRDANVSGKRPAIVPAWFTIMESLRLMALTCGFAASRR